MQLADISALVSLKGKTAIVTGGAVGIGYGIAYRLAEAGAAVVIADTNLAAADASVAMLTSLGWKATAMKTDVSQHAEVDAMIAATIAAYGSIDILVNNAGIYPNVPLMKMAEADFEKILDVNLKSVFLCTQHVAQQMIAQGKGGKVINITSIDALHPSMVGLAMYDASKHGLWGFTKNVALELAPHNIWVNAIAPGGVRTPGAGMGDMSAEEVQKTMGAFLEKIPMRRMGEPDDIGKVALFLASDMASYMTGAQIVVDGGVLLS